RRVVFAGAEHAGDGGRGQRRPLPAHGAAGRVRQAVDHAAAFRRAVLQVVAGLVDDGLGHDDAGVPRRPQRLNLRDRHRALVKAVALQAGEVAPTAAGRLRLAGELDGAGEDVFELAATVAVFL